MKRMKTDASLAQLHTHIVLTFSSMPGSKAGSAVGLGGGGEEGWVVVVAAVVVVVPAGPAEYIRAKEEKKGASGEKAALLLQTLNLRARPRDSPNKTHTKLGRSPG
jgi:hypothetical protein